MLISQTNEPVTDETIQNCIQIRKLLPKEKTFIHLYVTYIYISIIKHYDEIVYEIETLRRKETELFEMVQVLKETNADLYKSILDQLLQIKNCATKLQTTADTMLEEIVNCKCGVTVEDFATWRCVRLCMTV